MSIPALNDTMAYLQYLTKLADQNRKGTDTSWVSSNTYLVFLMQAGFCFLEAGAVRHKNHVSALIKNTLDMTLTTICWWLIGYGFAFGKSAGGVIGTSFFAGDGVESFDQYNNWMFQWAFAGTSATIVSGSVLERITIWGFIYFSSWVTLWIYPLVVHWCWSDNGWLKALGFLDFAGSGVVHMVGGVAGLCLTLFIKPRIGRFSESQKVRDDFKPNYVSFIALGTFILWFCWYGFNCGSTVQIVGDDVTKLVGRIGMNTSISASMCGLTCFLFHYFLNKGTNDEFSPVMICNGILAGAVSITAGCNAVSSLGAFLIGLIGAFVYIGYTKLLVRLKIDDPLDASPIHFGCGSWGVVAVGWFHMDKGILYGYGGKLFGIQLLGVLVIFAWVFSNTLICYYILKYFKLERISAYEEIEGLDKLQCGGFVHMYDEVTINHYSQIFKIDDGKIKLKEEYEIVKNDNDLREIIKTEEAIIEIEMKKCEKQLKSELGENNETKNEKINTELRNGQSNQNINNNENDHADNNVNPVLDNNLRKSIK